MLQPMCIRGWLGKLAIHGLLPGGSPVWQVCKDDPSLRCPVAQPDRVRHTDKIPDSITTCFSLVLTHDQIPGSGIHHLLYLARAAVLL